MKKIAVLLVAMLIVIGSFAQKINDKDVPKGIMDDFNVKYPTAEKVMWSMDVKKYVAEFKHDDTDVKAIYENNYWQKTYWSVPLEYTPFKIKDYVNQYYAGYKIVKVDMVETNTNEKNYVAKVVKKKKESAELYFELAGTFLKKVDNTPEVKK